MKPGADTANQAAPGEAAQRDRGRRAEKPTQIPARGWWDIARRTFQQMSEDNLNIVAAGVAFYAFVAMVPALAAVIAIYALVNDPVTVTQQIESMAHLLPAEAQEILREQLTRLTEDNQSAGWGAALGIGIALFGAMKAMNALIIGLNITFDEKERRGFIKLYFTSFVMTLAGIVGAILAVSVVAVLPSLLRFFGSNEMAQTIVSIVRWPLLAFLFMSALAAAYRFAPCRDKPQWRWVSWGAALATLLWLAGSLAFSLYVSSMGDYEGTYGSLGAVVVFLMWLFLSSYVILLGSELDAEMERQTVRDTTAGPEEPMGHRGAHAADTLGAAKGKKK